MFRFTKVFWNKCDFPTALTPVKVGAVTAALLFSCNTLPAQTFSAEEKLAKAIEMGDTNGVIEAQRSITRLAIENDRAQQAKVQQERVAQQQQAMLHKQSHLEPIQLLNQQI